MNNQKFNEILERRVLLMRQVLERKAEEYSSDDDRLHNFKIHARLNGITPEQSAWFLAGKHLVSIRDMVLSGETYTAEAWDEKIGDAINYLVLLEALTFEKRDIVQL